MNQVWVGHLADTFPAAAGVGDVWNPVLTFPAGFNLIIGYAAGLTSAESFQTGQ